MNLQKSVLNLEQTFENKWKMIKNSMNVRKCLKNKIYAKLRIHGSMIGVKNRQKDTQKQDKNDIR